MQKLSISDIQRNLHKLDEFDIVEIIDKKKNMVKGYYIQSKYAIFVEEVEEKIRNMKKSSKSIAGIFKKYANKSLISREKEAFKEKILEKYKK